jgi:hypothetical protein
MWNIFRSDRPESSTRINIFITILATVPIQFAVAFHIFYMTGHYGASLPVIEILQILKGSLNKGASFSDLVNALRALPTPVHIGIEWVGVAAFETAMAGLYLALLYGKSINKSQEVEAGETSTQVKINQTTTIP